MQHVYQTAEFYRQRSGISEGGKKEEKNKAGGYFFGCMCGTGTWRKESI